jgi:hypothetical protein
MAAKDAPETKKKVEDVKVDEPIDLADAPAVEQKAEAPKPNPNPDPEPEPEAQPQGALFAPAEGFNRVELAIQGLDELITVEGEFRTSDPLVIAALDAHPFVIRVPKGGES